MKKWSYHQGGLGLGGGMERNDVVLAGVAVELVHIAVRASSIDGEEQGQVDHQRQCKQEHFDLQAGPHKHNHAEHGQQAAVHVVL